MMTLFLFIKNAFPHCTHTPAAIIFPALRSGGGGELKEKKAPCSWKPEISQNPTFLPFRPDRPFLNLSALGLGAKLFWFRSGAKSDRFWSPKIMKESVGDFYCFCLWTIGPNGQQTDRRTDSPSDDALAHVRTVAHILAAESEFSRFAQEVSKCVCVCMYIYYRP